MGWVRMGVPIKIRLCDLRVETGGPSKDERTSANSGTTVDE